jgi:peptidoglycan/xylan/chitin deacetylase (PgdA/CDA1 family)
LQLEDGLQMRNLELLIALMCALGVAVAYHSRMVSVAGQTQRLVAITFDDLPLYGPPVPPADAKAAIENLLAALSTVHAPATGFVNGSVDDEDKEEIQIRDQLLRIWARSGVELGNHTYSHLNFSEVSLKEFENDFIRCDRLISRIVPRSRGEIRFFRYPYLSSGADPKKHHAFEQLLRTHGYRTAPASIVSFEWLFADLYDQAAAKKDREMMQRLGSDYVSYMQKDVEWSESLSQDVLGRQIPHILLLHASRLNAQYLPEILQCFQSKDYAFITLATALNDEAYTRTDKYPGAEGVTWLQRVTDNLQLRLRHEPCPPLYVRQQNPDPSPCTE